MSLLLRLVLLGVGLFAGLMAVLAGLAIACGVVVWALVRGRKPQVGVRMERSTPFHPMRPRAPAGDVVDIEAREVREALDAPNRPR